MTDATEAEDRPGDAGAWRDAWVAALDDLELTLEQTEQLLAGDQPVLAAAESAAWVPPLMAAALPDDMLVRAQALLGRQRALIERTTAAMTATRQQLGLTDRLAQAGGKPAARPVYVDLTA